MIRRQLAALVAFGAVLAAMVGCAPTAPPPSAAAPAVTTEPAPAAAPLVDPVALTIASLNLSAPVDRTGLNADNTVAVPGLDRPERAAWVDAGPHPGQVGRALIVGHINGGGHPGVFADLATIAIGADIVVTDANGADQRFTVTRVGSAPKTGFPTGAVYGDVAGPELVLVTCGGDLDASGHSYLDNTIVFASLAA